MNCYKVFSFRQIATLSQAKDDRDPWNVCVYDVNVSIIGGQTWWNLKAPV